MPLDSLHETPYTHTRYARLWVDLLADATVAVSAASSDQRLGMAGRFKRRRPASAPLPPPAIRPGFMEVAGEVTEVLPSAMFRVKLENGQEILSHLAGKMRLNHIKVLPGDRVLLEMTPYDLTKGRIIYRYT